LRLEEQVTTYKAQDKSGPVFLIIGTIQKGADMTVEKMPTSHGWEHYLPSLSNSNPFIVNTQDYQARLGSLSNLLFSSKISVQVIDIDGMDGPSFPWPLHEKKITEAEMA
jgi:hypothetical protein